MEPSIRLLDAGTRFESTIRDQDGNVVNLAAATTLRMIFRRPDGTRIERDATLVTDGSDGRIQYIAQAGELDAEGLWQRQAFVALPGWQGHTDPVDFYVAGNL